jgi:nitroreductase
MAPTKPTGKAAVAAPAPEPAQAAVGPAEAGRSSALRREARAAKLSSAADGGGAATAAAVGCRVGDRVE